MDEEKEFVTGLAMEDLAAQRGASPEEIAQRADASRAAAMRDRALQQYLQRKQEMERRRREQGAGRHDGESK